MTEERAPVDIRDVLNRRTDLSTFVVHLTKRTEELSARQVLDKIIEERVLRAGAPMGWAKHEDDPAYGDRWRQRVVCFSEAPLEHIYSLVANIEGRQVKLEPYGVAFTKVVARRRGINPVWYVDMSPTGRDWDIAHALDALRDEAVEAEHEGVRDFADHPIARITPFIEAMGTWGEGSRKEFWWEREWRHVGPLYLPLPGCIWLAPEDELDDLKLRDGEPCIDPRWGLEQIIAHLAGLPPGDVTPFLPR